MTVPGGELPEHQVLAPHIEHPVRLCIVEAIEWIGPLSVTDLMHIVGDPRCQMAHVAYHAKVLVGEGSLAQLGGRSNDGALEALYYLPLIDLGRRHR